MVDLEKNRQSFWKVFEIRPPLEDIVDLLRDILPFLFLYILTISRNYLIFYIIIIVLFFN